MEEIKILYSKVSPKKSLILERTQILIAAFCLILGASDLLNKFDGWFLIIPSGLIFIAFINLIVAALIKKIKLILGQKFFLFLTNLIALEMFFTAINLQIQFSSTLSIIYYFLAFFYFSILPVIHKKVEQRRTLTIAEDCIIINNKKLKNKYLFWNVIKYYGIKENLFYLKTISGVNFNFYIVKEDIHIVKALIDLIKTEQNKSLINH